MKHKTTRRNYFGTFHAKWVYSIQEAPGRSLATAAATTAACFHGVNKHQGQKLWGMKGMSNGGWFSIKTEIQDGFWSLDFCSLRVGITAKLK